LKTSARFGQLSRIWVAKSIPGFGIWPAIANIGGQIVVPASQKNSGAPGLNTERRVTKEDYTIPAFELACKDFKPGVSAPE
jgi:hypothetical protein